MHQTKKGNECYFGVKTHINVDAESGLMHTVIGTVASVNDVTQSDGLPYGREQVYADAEYEGGGEMPGDP